MVVNGTLEAKKSLNEVGIGISVVTDVLATICYLTPSQAHFTDAGDFVQLSMTPRRCTIFQYSLH